MLLVNTTFPLSHAKSVLISGESIDPRTGPVKIKLIMVPDVCSVDVAEISVVLPVKSLNHSKGFESRAPTSGLKVLIVFMSRSLHLPTLRWLTEMIRAVRTNAENTSNRGFHCMSHINLSTPYLSAPARKQRDHACGG
jgi:hypothetical protein